MLRYYSTDMSIPINGGISPTIRKMPSVNAARQKAPSHMLMIDAFLLCLVMAASIISFTSCSVIAYPGSDNPSTFYLLSHEL